MAWGIFKDIFDAELCGQMCDMIYRLSKSEEKAQIWAEAGKYAMFSECWEKTLEDSYGFRYPGEVLERLAEKTEVVGPQIRALGLALGMTRRLQEKEMFIGTQMGVFRKKLEGYFEENTLYIWGIRYLLDEKTRKVFYEKLLAYPYEKLEEILFAISVLPEDKKLWEMVKGKLNERLGKKREIAVYENADIYIWLAEHFQGKMKGYRKKDMDALKYLIRLPFANANGTGVLQKKLIENGYSIEEIQFLNMALIWNVRTADGISRDSITAERIAVDVCRQFLHGQEEYPQPVYQLCKNLCNYYREFSIKINGWENIFEAAGSSVEVSNTAIYRVLHSFKIAKHVKTEWHHIDLTDAKWDSLFEWLGEEEFDSCVTDTLSEREYSRQQLSLYLERYKEITKKEYGRHFWQEQDYKYISVFWKLADFGILEPIMLIREFLDGYREDKKTAETKWKNIAFYLKRYMDGINSENAFEMMKLLVDTFGISNQCMLFPLANMIRDSFSLGDYEIRYGETEVFRPFLDAEAHRQIFMWAEEYVISQNPEKYVRFLLAILADEDNFIWLPRSDAKDIALEILEHVELEKSEQDQLRKIYWTTEEYVAYQNKLALAKQQKELMERMKKYHKLKQNFTKIVARTRGKEGHIKNLDHFLSYCSYRDRDMAYHIVASYLKSTYSEHSLLVFSEQNLAEILDLLREICSKYAFGLEKVKEIINHMEVVQSEENNIMASENM